MTRADSKTYEKLIHAFEPGSRLIEVKPLHGGLSASTTLIEIESAIGKRNRFVIRRPPPWQLQRNLFAAEVEFNLLRALYDIGIPVPKPIYLDQEGKYLGTPSLTLEFSEGATLFSPKDISDAVDQMACKLAELHQVPIENLNGASSKKEAILISKKADIEYSFEENHILNFLQMDWPIPSKNKLALCHGDFWPGNLIWKYEKLTLVIDWEASGLQDPLLDLAISRLDILWLFGKSAMNDFTRVYLKKNPIDASDLPYWDLWAGQRTGGKMALWASVYPGLGRADVTEATMRADHIYFVNQAFNEIENKK